MEKIVSFINDNLALTIVIISLIIVAIACLIMVIIIKKKSKPRIKVDDEFIDKLVLLFGGLKNISIVAVDNGRLKITVLELDSCDLEGLKAISEAGVFVTGFTIKILFKLDSLTIKKAIDKRL